MKLPSISYDPISKLIDLLVDAGIDKIKELTDRSAKVIAIRKQLNLGAEKPLADDFDGVYAFTLAKYYEGNYPKAILEFFGDAIIKDAFQRSFKQRNYGILEEEAENFLDWNKLGKQFQTLDIQPQAHFDEFQQLFYESIELTKLPKDVVQDHNFSDLGNRVTSLEDEVEEIKEGKEQVLPPPFILPPIDITKFTGREKELKDLEDLIFNQEGSRVVGIVGLTGTGGMGKSALAVHFAHEYKERFPDGVIGIRVDRGTTDEIARNFALQVVTKVDPELKAHQIMQRYFQNRRALLILDNVEDATARELEPGGDKCAVIITTRNRNLNLGTTGKIDLNRFSPKETRDLLVSFLGEKRVNEEPDAAHRIHELVGGLPLAIRVVGGALVDEKEATLNEFANRLESERNRLYLNDPEDESLDVHASINVSLRKLDEIQIYLYSCLSVCAPEGFSSETVKAVSQLETDIVKTNLARLVKLSLLDFSEEKKRYLLHPLLFDAAYELAKGNNPEIKSNETYTELLTRHTNYFTDFVKQNRGQSAENLNKIEIEIDSILLTVERLLRNKTFDFEFYQSIEPFYEVRGYWSQALRLIDEYLKFAEKDEDWVNLIRLLLQRTKFLRLAGKSEWAKRTLFEAQGRLTNIQDHSQIQSLQAMILNSLGDIYELEGNFDKAVETLKASAQIEFELNNPRGQGVVLNSLGSVFQRQGNFFEAIDAFKQSLDKLVESHDIRGQAKVLNSLGGVLQRQGNFKEAVDVFQKSAEIEKKLGNERGQAMVLTSLGGVLQRQGNFKEAVDVFQKSAEIEKKLGNERGQAMVLNSLGGVLQRQGKFDEAVTAFQRSYAIWERLEDDRGQAMVLNSLGGVLQRQGKFDEAVTAFQRSYAIWERLEDDRGQAMVLNSLGGVLQRQGKFDEAIDAFQRSLAVSSKLGDERSVAMVTNSLGGVLQRQGKFDEAATTAQNSLSISNRMGDQHMIAMVLNSLGGVQQRQGKFDEAVDTFQKSYELLVKLGDDRGQAMVLNSLGGVLQRQGKFDESVDVFQKSYELLVKLGDDRGQAMVLNSLGGVLQRQGKFDEAVDAFQRSYELLVKLGDDRGQAMVLNSLGGVLQRQGKFDEAVDAFQKSVNIGKKLADNRHLAMALNSLGGVFLLQKKFDEAQNAFQQSYEIETEFGNELGQAKVHFGLGKLQLEKGELDLAKNHLLTSFGINERLHVAEGMRIVTPSIVRVFGFLGQKDMAIQYVNKALAIAPKDKRLMRLLEQLSEDIETSLVSTKKSGYIKKTIRNLSGYLYGFIIPDDSSGDIYFGQDQVDEEVIPKLAEGLSVWVEVEMAARGPRARRVWLKE